MGTDAKLQLILQARDDASAVLKELNRALSGTAQEAKGASGGMSSFGDTLKALISFDVLKGVWEKGTGFIGSFSEAAGEGQIASLNLSRALSGIGINYNDVSASIDTLITSQVKLNGVNEEDTKNAISTLVDITKSYNDSLKLLPLTIDVARAKQMSLAEAADLVGRAATGNDTRLQRMLGLMSDATTATETLAEAQRRYGGYAEEYANTQVGSAERWANVVDRMKDIMGTAFLPLTTSLTTALSAAGEAMQPQLQVISENIRTWAIGAVADFFYWGANMVQSLAGGVVAGAPAVVDALNSIGAFFTDLLQGHSPPKLLPDLTKWGTSAMQAYLDGWSQASSGASGILNNWGAMIAPFLQQVDLGGLFTGDMGKSISGKFGDKGGMMSEYVSSYADLKAATEGVTTAQKELDALGPDADAEAIKDAKNKLTGAKAVETAEQKRFKAAQARVREEAEAQAKLTAAIKQQTEAIKSQSKASDDAAAKKAAADAKALAAAKLAYEMSKTDTSGKIALLDAEAAQHAEGSLEWYQIETQKQGLLKQLQSEQDAAARAAEAAAKAAATANKNQVADLDVLQEKTNQYQMPDFLDPAVMKLKKTDTLWDLIVNLGESLGNGFIKRFWDVCYGKLLVKMGLLSDSTLTDVLSKAGTDLGTAIGQAMSDAIIAKMSPTMKWLLGVGGGPTEPVPGARQGSTGASNLPPGTIQGPGMGTETGVGWQYNAAGFDGIVSQATKMIVGEAGPERVTVTPQGRPGYNGGNVTHQWFIRSTEPKKAADEVMIRMRAEGIA